MVKARSASTFTMTRSPPIRSEPSTVCKPGRGFRPMLSDEKILITGPAGKIAFGVAESLAADNEVWGISRFGDPQARARVDALGVTTRAVDLGSGTFADLPTDFTYLIHIAVAYEPS